MAKLTRDEFNTKYSEQITDNDDLLVSLMEDFEDSVSNDVSEELERLRAELEKAKADFLELKEKYKSRFLEVKKDIKEESLPDEIKEEEVIDVKEI